MTIIHTASPRTGHIGRPIHVPDHALRGSRDGWPGLADLRRRGRPERHRGTAAPVSRCRSLRMAGARSRSRRRWGWPCSRG